MLKKGVKEALGVTDVQCVVCLIAAAAHDFRHPGIGAPYLINTGHELALTCAPTRGWNPPCGAGSHRCAWPHGSSR